MGVTHHYCGKCREISHEDYFPGCRYCCEMMEHESGHGYYCESCFPDDAWITIGKNRFCSDNCRKEYDEYIEEGKLKAAEHH